MAEGQATLLFELNKSETGPGDTMVQVWIEPGLLPGTDFKVVRREAHELTRGKEHLDVRRAG